MKVLLASRTQPTESKPVTWETRGTSLWHLQALYPVRNKQLLRIVWPLPLDQLQVFWGIATPWLLVTSTTSASLLIVARYSHYSPFESFWSTKSWTCRETHDHEEHQQGHHQRKNCRALSWTSGDLGCRWLSSRWFTCENPRVQWGFIMFHLLRVGMIYIYSFI